MAQIIHFPVVNMKEAPLPTSRVVSQALFGEEILVKKSGAFNLIQTPDGYEGWVPQAVFTERKNYRKDVQITRLSAHIYDRADTEFGPLCTLAYGSPLELVEPIDARWLAVELPNRKRAFVQRGDVEEENVDFETFCKKFLNLPYTWGGRSSFGFDCSGFVQMVYAKFGLWLPRDARQQILDGRGRETTDLKKGDLLFWGYSEREIKHVGIYLEKDQFIHTSSKENKPYLRISSLQDPSWNASPQNEYCYRKAVAFDLVQDTSLFFHQHSYYDEFSS